MKPQTVVRAAEMLSLLLQDGATYREVGNKFGLTHSTVERQIRALLARAAREHRIEPVGDPSIATLAFLRQHASAVMAAVRALEPNCLARQTWESLTPQDMVAGVNRVRRYSDNANRDVALLYVLFCTGAKPLEIARLLVRDYLHEDGSIRRRSVLAAGTAVGGRARPLYFDSAKACAAVDAYLEERTRRRLAPGRPGRYRGLQPDSRLFLTESGQPFEVRARSRNDPRLWCPVLLATYSTILRRAGWEGMTPRDARRMVAQRLSEKGADDHQVGELLGLATVKSVRRLLDRRSKQPLEALVKDLV